MKHFLRLTFAPLLLVMLVCKNVSADQEQPTSLSVWDHVYGSYDATAKDWRNVPGIQLYSYASGSPYFDIRPKLDTVEHRGKLGFELGNGFSVLNGQNARIEFGGASEEDTYKQQLDNSPTSDGPIIPKLKNPGETAFDLSGFGGLSSRQSYTFTHLHRKYFVDYKLDYPVSSQLILTPSLGYVYSRLDQTHLVHLTAPAFNSYVIYTETINSVSHGIRAGLSAEIPLGDGYSFVCGSLYTLNYDDNNLDVKVFDVTDGPLYVDDGQSRLTHTTDLTLGLQKKFGSTVVAVSGGFSFYSYVPRIVNPIRASDMDAHLEGQNAYNQFIQLSVSYAV